MVVERGGGVGKLQLSTIFKLLAVLYVAHKVLPMVGHYMPSIIYAGIFAILIVFLLTCAPKAMNSKDALYLLMIFSVSLLETIPYITAGNTTSTMIYLYGEMQILLYGWLILWYVKYTDLKSTKKVLFVIALFYIFTAVTTYLGCTRFPLAARYMAANSGNDPTYQMYVSNNIGGFTFVYETVLLLPLLIYLFKSKKINRIFCLLLFVVIGAAVIKTEYTTALLVFIIDLFLIFMRKLTTRRIIVFILICALVIAVGNLFLADFFDYLSVNVDSEEYSTRFSFIADLLKGDTNTDASDSGSSRLDLYQKSWDSFWNSSMVGGWGNSPIGGHSFILDTMGEYGFIGLICVVFVYFGIYKYSLRPYKNEDFYPYLLWSYIIAIILAVLNPKPNLFVFICIIPLFAQVMRKRMPNRKK